MKETLAGIELRARFPEERLQDARRAAAGLSKQKLEALQDELGVTAVVEALAALGRRLPDGETFDAQVTEDAVHAYEERRAKKADPDFTKRLLRGDPAAKDLWRDLHEMADPPRDRG